MTYTAWYPAHPRLKTIDLDEAAIDSCTVRVTLDAEHAPLFYETIGARGRFHKIFVERWLEDGAAKKFGPAVKGKKYAIDLAGKAAIDWEVAGVVEEPRDQPRRSVVFLRAGDHRVIGMGGAARLREPAANDVRTYEVTDYAVLYSLPVLYRQEKAPFFDWEKGVKVWGAERKEQILSSAIGVDGVGQPRATNGSNCTSIRPPGAIRRSTNAACACRRGRCEQWSVVSGQ